MVSTEAAADRYGWDQPPLLFGLFDPEEMLRYGQPAGLSRLALQTAAFFVFWLACAASSALTVLLMGPAPGPSRRQQAAAAQEE